MNDSTYLNNQFLIATPNLLNSGFTHSVVYCCQHNAEGALGLVINRPIKMTLRRIFEQMEITAINEATNNIPIFLGGPVQPERGFIIHPTGKKWEATLEISKSLSLTTSQDILEAVAKGEENPEKLLIALGYSGWEEGQLEQEIVENSWINAPATESIIFDVPINQRWEKSAQQIGIDINLLTAPVGHG